jgi:uncharacterized membrane protein
MDTALPLSPPPAPRIGSLGWFRNKLVAGLFVAFPVVATLLLLRFLYGIVNDLCDPLVRAIVAHYHPYIPGWLLIEKEIGGRLQATIPGAGLVLTLVLLLFLGIGASNFFGKRIVQTVDAFLLRLPIVKTFYNLAKQMVEAVQGASDPGGLQSKQVVYVRYPGVNGYIIGFLTSRWKNAQGVPMGMVFIPTSPNPITGFTLVFEEKDILVSDLDMETAWKAIVSAGIVMPKQVLLPIHPLSTPPA